MMKTWKQILRVFVSLLVGLGFMLPLYFTLTTSLDTPAHVFTFPPHLMLDFNWDVYRQAWGMFHWLVYFRNTVVIAILTIVLALATTILAAYAFSFIHFRGRNLVFTLVLLVLMIPSETHLIPNFVIMAKMGLVDTIAAQVLPYGATAFGIFLLRQSFQTIPRDYWEAARVDGCGHFRFMRSIAVPLSRETLITIALYIFIGCWNSLIWPLMVTQSVGVQPIELALTTFLTTNSSDWQGLSAASIFSTLPIIVIYVILQKYVIWGISRGEGVRF